MQIIFRKYPSEETALVPAGEVHLRPGGLHRDRRDLATLALEMGIEGFQAGPGTPRSIVVGSDPTFDDMLAAALLSRKLTGQPHPDACKAFARYSGLAREGLRPGTVPLEVSLEGIYLAIRHDAGKDLTVPEARSRFLAAWSQLSDCIFQAAEKGLDPFAKSLFETGAEFARERSFLQRDHEVYRNDIQAGERWLVRITPEGGETSVGRHPKWLNRWTMNIRVPFLSGLVLHRPHSLLFKYWSRNDPDAPMGQTYHFLAVNWGEGNWVFSTDPVFRLSLKGLAEELQAAEKAVAPENADTDRWFDGKPFGHTLVAAPRPGSKIPSAQILKIVRKWTGAQPVTSQEKPASRRKVAAILAACVLLVGGIGLAALFIPKHPTNGTQNGHGTQNGQRGFAPDKEPDDVNRGVPGKLYLLAVGISTYKEDRLKLEFAANDARTLEKTFRDNTRGLFSAIESKILIDADATRDNIINELEELKNRLTQYDLVVVTFSGHGDNLDRQGSDDFYFLPYDFKSKNRQTTGVFWDDLKRNMKHYPCRVVLVMDTCHSGTITKRLRSDADRTSAIEQQLDKKNLGDFERGLFVLAACLSRGKAHERPEWGHGALTMAILEALTGKYLYQDKTETSLPKGQGPKKVVSLFDLSYYVTNRVNELVGGTQNVVSNNTGNMNPDRIPLVLRGE